MLCKSWVRPVVASRGQFHQHFTRSFYARRSSKAQKDSLIKQLFALSGSVSVKDACKQIDERDPKDTMSTQYPLFCRGKLDLDKKNLI